MIDDEAWSERLQQAVGAVRDWEKRITNLDDVESKSSIDQDDNGLPGHPVRSAAWYGLVAAVDHLALGADLADNGLTIRPTSIFTVTRAALLGASQAVWVLSGNREERRYRALAVESDERKQHRGFLQDYASDPFIRDTLPPKSLAVLDRDAKRLTDDIQSLQSLRKGNPYDGNLVSTTMMREAAAYLAQREDTEEWLRLVFAYEWRMTSAAAHARSWPTHIRPTERIPLPGGGERRTLATSLSDIVQSYGAAFLMTNLAWKLWDLRRQRQI